VLDADDAVVEPRNYMVAGGMRTADQKLHESPQPKGANEKGFPSRFKPPRCLPNLTSTTCLSCSCRHIMDCVDEEMGSYGRLF
jgi:hypothetical protein